MTQFDDQPEKIDEDLQSLAQSVADLAGENGADQRACEGLASLSIRWQSPRLPAIMVGEVSSGKSTLINALLGTRVLPADFRVATSAWTHLSYGPRLTATAYIQGGPRFPSGTEAVELDPSADLPVYLTVDGYDRFAARHGNAARTLSVDITIPAPVLESGLELLDTPGVGGLRAAHRRITLNALTEADAVIFVTKPGEPLSKSELLTLADAVDRVQACVLVHTHRDERADADQALVDDLTTLTDAKRWMALLADQERADALAVRFASVPGVSVSASNALDAADRPDGPARQHLTDASNLPLLREILDTQIVARGRTIHRGNIVRLMDVLLQSIRARTEERIMILEGGVAATAAIDALEALIAKWVAHNGDYWRPEYEAACDKLPGKINAFAQRRAGELDRAHRNQFLDMKDAQLREAVQDLLAQPEIVFADMLKIASDGIDGAANRVNELLKSEGLGSAREQMKQTTAVFERLSGRRSELPADASRVRGDVDDVRSALLGGLAGIGATGAAAAVLQGAGLIAAGAAAPLVLPFALGAVLFVGINRYRRKKTKTVETAREILTEVCQEITTTAAATARQAALKAKSRVAQDIDEALAEEEKRIRRAREDLSESANLAPDQRQLRLAEAAEVIDRCEELSIQLAELQNRVSATADKTTGPEDET